MNTFRDIVRAFSLCCFLLFSLSHKTCTAEAGSATLKYEEPKLLRGTIYSADRKKPLFKFVRRTTREGNRLTAIREYNYLDGKAALKEKVLYDGDQLVEYTVDDFQLGTHGSARISAGRRGPHPTIFYEYQKEFGSSKKLKTGTEPWHSNCVIGDTVAPFLADHWDALLRGEEIKCRYIVLDRRETIGFTLVKDSEARSHGENLLIVKMYPTSSIISALVDPIYFTIKKDGPRRILEYSGRTAVKVKEGTKWKDLDGVTVFEW